MKPTQTALTLLLGGILAVSPVAALANESGDDSVSASATVEANADVRAGDREHPRGGILDRVLKDRPGIEDRFRLGNGSSTQGRPASTTRPEREHMEKPEHPADPAKAQERGGEKIDERIKKMQEQITRIAKMERLSDEQKASITAELNAQITALTTLKASIGTETDPIKLKDLTQSITKAYRVYAVTMPKAAITAASDRIMKVVAQMEAITVKLDTRVSASSSTEAATALTDFKAKVADAKVQAQAAASLVANLSADNGDATVAASNTAAMKSAKEKIDLAQKDLKDARKDIGTILKAVKGTETPSNS